MVFLRPACVVLLGAVAAGCGSEPDAAAAKAAFLRANDILHELHLDVFELPAWPTTDYERACAQGGSIVMRSEVDAQGAPADLFHAFRACSLDDVTFDGQLDYRDLVPCANNTYTYAMEGRLEITGLGECTIEAQQTCGVDAGSACGIAL